MIIVNGWVFVNRLVLAEFYLYYPVYLHKNNHRPLEIKNSPYSGNFKIEFTESIITQEIKGMKLICLSIFYFFASAKICFSQNLIDEHATKETKALYKNLRKLSKNYILFGHQHATEYGHDWTGDEDRSDVKSVTGSDPAFIGLKLSELTG